MKILELEFEDKVAKWKLHPLKLNAFTLLVGVSGVGKTKILDAIRQLKRIAAGEYANGIRWKITFSLSPEQTTYVWEGEFESIVDLSQLYGGDIPENRKKISYECIKCGDLILAERKQQDTFFKGQQTPRLPTESLISIFKEESLINPIYWGFQRIIYSDQTKSLIANQKEGKLLGENPSFLNQVHNLDTIRELDCDLIVKLYLTQQINVFFEIKRLFIDVFPQVEDLNIKETLTQSTIGRYPKLTISIKEKGVETWIKQSQISTGMFRTLMHISELYLSPDGTVNLIDEFENSLGVNCINELTRGLLNTNRDIQFIITSHHPYIINAVDQKYWKIVTRKAGDVTVLDAPDIMPKASRHESFLQLTNLPEFLEGIHA